MSMWLTQWPDACLKQLQAKGGCLVDCIRPKRASTSSAVPMDGEVIKVPMIISEAPGPYPVTEKFGKVDPKSVKLLLIQ